MTLESINNQPTRKVDLTGGSDINVIAQPGRINRSVDLHTAVSRMASGPKLVGEATHTMPPTVEIPRALSAEDLRSLTQTLTYEVALGVTNTGVYLAKGDKDGTAPNMFRVVDDPNSIILDIHTHPINLPNFPGGYTAKSISEEDVHVTGSMPFDAPHAMIGESQMIVWGRPTKIPEGIDPLDLDQGDAPRELMLLFLRSKGVSLNFPRAGMRFYYDLPLEEQDSYIHQLIVESGMMIAQIPWSDTTKASQAMEIINTASSRNEMKQRFAALQPR